MWRPRAHIRKYPPFLPYLLRKSLSTKPRAWQQWLARPKTPFSALWGVNYRQATSPTQHVCMFLGIWTLIFTFAQALSPLSQQPIRMFYPDNSFPKVVKMMGIHQTHTCSFNFSEVRLPSVEPWDSSHSNRMETTSPAKSYHWASAIHSKLLAWGRDLEVKSPLPISLPFDSCHTQEFIFIHKAHGFRYIGQEPLEVKVLARMAVFSICHKLIVPM